MSSHQNSQTNQQRIFLSPPHMGKQEQKLVAEVFASNYIAPLGAQVDAFEKECAAWGGVEHAAALSSGTAAIHLALRLLNLQPGDEVLCSTLTFCASANPIVYEGGCPVFIDSERETWNMDADLLREELKQAAGHGKLPRAVVVVDLYGQCADYDPIRAVCAEYDVPIIEDSAEAIGATYKGQKAGSFGKFGVFSFNGNKIITTSGGGMLLSDDEKSIKNARFLAQQARDDAPHYEHSQIGYNYRMSNVLAAIGRGQLQVLLERIVARKRNFEFYKAALGDLPGVEFMPIASFGEPNYWLSCLTINPLEFGATRENVRLALEKEAIESRPVWKPLHLQPVFKDCRAHGGAVAEDIFEHGLCLPSGSALTKVQLEKICDLVHCVAAKS